MPEVKKSVLVAHSARQMFDLVDSVEHYPEFLPWCSGAKVLARDEHHTRATLSVDYYGVKQRFTTENGKVAPVQMSIRLVEGPFRTLNGSWHFHALSDHACKIEFALHYEFSSRLLEKLVGPVFGYIANTLVEAFIKRAERVYAGR